MKAERIFREKLKQFNEAVFKLAFP